MRKPLPPVNKADWPEISNDGIIWLELVRNRVVDIRSATFTFDPISIAANTTVEQTVTLTGLKTDDLILSVIKPTFTAGIAVGQGRISLNDTLAITFINASGGAVNPPSETYTVVYIKDSRALFIKNH